MKITVWLWACLFCPLISFAQFSVSGRITDKNSNQPLPGATVLLEGNGVSSDANGNFTLNNISSGSKTLIVSFVGYETSRQQLQINQNLTLTIGLQATTYRTGEVMISATRANEKTATTFTNVTKEEIAKRNFGQDLPYLLEQTPSVVVNSDAGAGVGYTGIRIRGSDITRINVTVNGIPINDPESHGTFFVNMPDLASSVTDIQVQRGVGTSTNGAAAFGASLNISTLQVNPDPYIETNNSAGSFDTWKHTINFGTGLVQNKFSIDGRLSKISSDGYIDRAFSDLKSYYLAAGYHGKTGMLKFITFSGQEQTYQAWYGIPEEKLKTERTFNSLTYENETDNYQQDHYQLHYSKNLGRNFELGGAFFLTRGKGFYEQFKKNQRLTNYNIQPVVVGTTTISRSDLIRRKWLDNNFYGATYALNYTSTDGRLTGTAGGGWNQYDGDHYGEVIWARYASNSNIRHRYYDGNALKNDFNIFGKVNYDLTSKLGLFADLQYRTIGYELSGTDDDKRDVTQDASYQFFNPKGGLTYALTEAQRVYASFAVGNREPVRSDFVDRKGTEEPKPETLYNLETGYRVQGNAGTLWGQLATYSLDANYYYMNYNNQLVLTGQLNDVGSPLRTNIKKSYRTGVEFAGKVNLNELVEITSSVALSRNKINNYSETVYVYDPNYSVVSTDQNNYKETDIAFSPEVVTAHAVEFQFLKNLKSAILYKTVSQQYLDNTADQNRKINGYGVMDLRFRYNFNPGFFKNVEAGLLVNNVLNKKYEANGYTYSERYAGDVTRYDYNFYYPQATRNFLVSLGIKF